VADLREPDQVAPLIEAIDAVAHLAIHATFPTPDASAEKEALDVASRGTFVLLHEALKAGVGRFVLASRLDLLLGAYPEEQRVNETWKPLPDATAAALAPFLAESTLREFARAEEIVGVCLRFGELYPGPAHTSPEDATAAIERALTMDLAGHKYRWWLYHIGSTERYRSRLATRSPFLFSPAEGHDAARH
jgi:nucleoside-diphosphate-sugar epimerase